MNQASVRIIAVLLSFALPALTLAASRRLTIEDYLCTIYPPGCPKVAKSTSQDLVYIDLLKGSLEPRPTRSESTATTTIAVPRAFIDWQPYLKPEPQAQVGIQAAIPNFSNPKLVPDSIWKASVREHQRVADSKALGDNDAHTHWVSIELSLNPDRRNIDCAKTYCPPTIQEEITKLRGNDFIVQSDQRSELFDRYLPKRRTTAYYQYEGKELVVVREPTTKATTFLICDRDANPLFNWCKVRTTLGDDVDLRYQFEARYLHAFPAIDSAVREFSSNALRLGASRG